MKFAFLFAAAACLLAAPALAGQTIDAGPFRSIELHGGGRIVLHSGGTQRITLVKGSTQHTSFYVDGGGNLEIDACRHDCPEGRYDLEIDIATPDISGLAIHGGGAIIGDADLPVRHFGASVEGGGNIDMRAVHAQSVNASVEGGGHIRVYAQSDLTAAVEGGGVIEYWGHPQIKTAIDGGGFVRAGL